MTRLLRWAFYGLFLVLATSAALLTRSSERRESSIPSIDNAGPAALRALYLYLAEGGRPVHVLHEPLTMARQMQGTLVIAAPVARNVEREEVEALEQFIRQGGRLVYLTPKAGQGVLHEWLGVRSGNELSREPLDAEMSDLLGTTVQVWERTGAMSRARTLRLEAQRGLSLPEEPGAAIRSAVAVAGTGPAIAGWCAKLGDGELWIFAGPSLAENRRLDLADNLAFWDALEGPITFDEFHHVAPQAPRPPPVLTVAALQLLACFLVFAWSAGARLGPPRAPPAERHRSSLEYIQSLGALARRSRVEKELLAELAMQLRVLMQEHLGIPVGLADDEAAFELEARCGIARSRYLQAMEELRASLGRASIVPKAYARLTVELAGLEREITGRAA